MAVEGQTAIGPNGERAVFRGGQWVVTPAQPRMPAKPGFEFEGTKAAADAARAQADATVATSTVDAEIRRANAQAAAAQAEANKLIAESNNGGRLTPGQQKADEAFATDYAAWTAGGGMAGLENKLRVLDEALDTIEGSDTITGPVFGRLPKFIQQMVDPRSQDVRADVEKAIQETLRQTLGAQFTAKEGESILARTFDPTQQEGSNARRMRNLIEELRSQGVAKDSAARYFQQNGTITGWTPPRAGELPNAMNTARLSSGGGLQAADAGATTQAVPLPPEMQQEHAAFLQQWMSNPDPRAYAQFRTELDRKYGYTGDPQEYLSGARRMAEGIASGRTISADIPPVEEVMTTGAFSEQARNDAVNNPFGAAVAGAADMGSFGAVRALPGVSEGLDALAEAQPEGMLVGQIGGAITGTGLIGRGVREATKQASRYVPEAEKLLEGGRRGLFGRNVATDVAYSGIYGGTSGNGALESAGQGGLGSIAGQIVGSGIGRGISGVTSSPTISRLRDLGVTPSLGQIMRGRAADNGGRSVVAGVEDVIANNGAVGTFVNSARGRALDDANLAAFNTVSGGRPITEIGEQGLEQLGSVKDAAYREALDGVTVPADDPNFMQNMRQAGQRGQAVDAARGRGDFSYIMDQELGPVLGEGASYSGDQLQGALRLLQGQSRAYQKAATGVSPDPAAMGVSRSLEEVTGALTDLAGEYSPDTLPRLNEANSIYRGLQVLDDAAARGMNEGGTFTGAQLGSAIKANTGKFEGRGLSRASQSPLYQLQQDMQTVLPNKVPPTGVNAAPMLALGSAAMGAGGYATDNDWMTAAGLLSLGALPYTRTGQAAVAKALLDRPEAIRRAGSLVRQNKGLFGRAALPFALD